MDRELAQRTLRAALVYAGIAVGVLALAFGVAIIYIRA
jgi:hypothetical protein